MSGAKSCGHASSSTETSRTTSDSRAIDEFMRPSTAIIGTLIRLNIGISRQISCVSPLFDRHTTTSSRRTIPKSPWTASDGWRKIAAVPVEFIVATILRAMIPDFPIPVTTILPFASKIIRTARSNEASILSTSAATDCASMRMTCFPFSISND